MSDDGRPADGDWIRSAVGRYERPLVVYAAHVLGGDVERARDVVQETFVRLCSQARDRVEPHLAEWLFTVCRNQAIDVRRKERRMSLLSEADTDSAASIEPAPGEAIERHEAMSQVMRSMEMLPDNQQEVIRLKFQHGLSYKQISEVTKLSVSNVGFLIHTGLKTLRRRLGEPGVALEGRVAGTR
jgi:RNA polymerase sigma-70 factor (ECF subfamily)